MAKAAAVFLDPRVLIILLLGFSSGLPLALSASTLLLWMKDVGVDLKTIGLFALVGTPYTIKFLWAPLVDAFQIPVLGRALGHRRGWLVFTQLLLIAALLFLGAQDPVASPWMVALAAVIVATASATQDIVIDAFRTEYLPTENQAAGMAYFVAAYRIGMLVSTAGIVALVAYLEFTGIDRGLIWFYGYAAMAALVLVGVAGALLAHEPQAKTRAAVAEAQGDAAGNPLKRFFVAAYAAFADFLGKRDALLILLFVVLYKLTDTFAGVMTGPFVLDIGFDKASYAAIVKGVGLIASLLGGVAGGLLARAMPLSPRAAGRRRPAGDRELHLLLARLARGEPSRLGNRHLDGEFHQRDRHGRVHRLSLGAVHQPGLYGDAIRPAHRALLVRPHPARGDHRVRRGSHGVDLVFCALRGGSDPRALAALAAHQARRLRRDRSPRARRYCCGLSRSFEEIISCGCRRPNAAEPGVAAAGKKCRHARSAAQSA